VIYDVYIICHFEKSLDCQDEGKSLNDSYICYKIGQCCQLPAIQVCRAAFIISYGITDFYLRKVMKNSKCRTYPSIEHDPLGNKTKHSIETIKYLKSFVDDSNNQKLSKNDERSILI